MMIVGDPNSPSSDDDQLYQEYLSQDEIGMDGQTQPESDHGILPLSAAVTSTPVNQSAAFAPAQARAQGPVQPLGVSPIQSSEQMNTLNQSASVHPPPSALSHGDNNGMMVPQLQVVRPYTGYEGFHSGQTAFHAASVHPLPSTGSSPALTFPCYPSLDVQRAPPPRSYSDSNLTYPLATHNISLPHPGSWSSCSFDAPLQHSPPQYLPLGNHFEHLKLTPVPASASPSSPGSAVPTPTPSLSQGSITSAVSPFTPLTGLPPPAMIFHPGSCSPDNAASKRRPSSRRSRSIPLTATTAIKARRTDSSSKRWVAKTSRLQFRACGACKIRRVKCDLKDKVAAAAAATKMSPGQCDSSNTDGASTEKPKVSCSNCLERGTNCVDEYAPGRRTKQLRRGKRISEVEAKYGFSATCEDRMDTDDSEEVQHYHSSVGGSVGDVGLGLRYNVSIPPLSPGFWTSEWFKHLTVRYPFLPAPNDTLVPSQETTMLHKVLYTLALSYGLNEHGQQVGSPAEPVVPPAPVNVFQSTEWETKNEVMRQKASSKLKPVIEVLLKEIDSSGILRRPSWEGVRAMLLFLPLLERHLPSNEFEAIADSTFCHVRILVQETLLPDPHRPQGAVGVESRLAQLTTFQCALVYESTRSGSKNGLMHLHMRDLQAIQAFFKIDSTNHSWEERAKQRILSIRLNLATTLQSLHTTLKDVFADPGALQRGGLSVLLANLDRCSRQIEAHVRQSLGPVDARVAQSNYDCELELRLELSSIWYTFHSALEKRLITLISKSANADPNLGKRQAECQSMLVAVHERCSALTEHIMGLLSSEVINFHGRSKSLEWCSSSTEEGILHVVKRLLKNPGQPSQEGIRTCLHALNLMTWSLSNAWIRSAELRSMFNERTKAHSGAASGKQDFTAHNGRLDDVGIPHSQPGTRRYPTRAGSQQRVSLFTQGPLPSNSVKTEGATRSSPPVV